MPSDSIAFDKALYVLSEAGYEYGHVSRNDIMHCVRDPVWQARRKAMKGKSTGEKILMLVDWWDRHRSHAAWVQVTNYLNALKRGGQLV